MKQDEIACSCDSGHSSIGWAAFRIADAPNDFHVLLGTGVVLFPKDSCLASARRGFRRSRRNIAARRSRVDRLKNYLVGLGVLSRKQLDANPNSHPWLLAARVLASGGQKTLTWEELWTVLRWYAHNRGYDGNALWASDGADSDEAEDTEKVENANALMEKHNTSTMAETFCKALGLDPLGAVRASRVYFKGNNAAFPRGVVTEEVRRILAAHAGKLPQMDDALCDVLLKNAAAAGLDLPARFKGGLLFGQYVPRFDNRIIPACRITGKNAPLKKCPEYLLYRWGRLLNNLTVLGADGQNRTLLHAERKALHARMEAEGYMTKRSLNAAMKEATGCMPANTESYFLTEEMEDALSLILSKGFWQPTKSCGKFGPISPPRAESKPSRHCIPARNSGWTNSLRPWMPPDRTRPPQKKRWPLSKRRPRRKMPISPPAASPLPTPPAALRTAAKSSPRPSPRAWREKTPRRRVAASTKPRKSAPVYCNNHL